MNEHNEKKIALLLSVEFDARDLRLDVGYYLAVILKCLVVMFALLIGLRYSQIF